MNRFFEWYNEEECQGQTIFLKPLPSLIEKKFKTLIDEPLQMVSEITCIKNEFFNTDNEVVRTVKDCMKDHTI